MRLAANSPETALSGQKFPPSISERASLRSWGLELRLLLLLLAGSHLLGISASFCAPNTAIVYNMSPPYPPPGKTAIITGGSSGIGLSCAKALVASGWNVVISGRRQTALESAAQEIVAAASSSQGPGKIAFIAGDASKEDDVIALFDFTLKTFGTLSLVFCNAGISPPATLFEDSSFADWQAALNTNLSSTYLCSREAFRKMRELGGGRIIINGSISAHVPRPDSAAYTASKHGVTGLTKSLALDGRKYNISLSQIDIGNAASDMTTKMTTGPGVKQADGSFRHEPVISRDIVAAEVRSIAELPLEVSKLWVTIQATGMPSMVGRG